ncbi:hypothetical protein D3C76_1256720 [compost metagenome]
MWVALIFSARLNAQFCGTPSSAFSMLISTLYSGFSPVAENARALTLSPTSNVVEGAILPTEDQPPGSSASARMFTSAGL